MPHGKGEDYCSQSANIKKTYYQPFSGLPLKVLHSVTYTSFPVPTYFDILHNVMIKDYFADNTN